MVGKYQLQFGAEQFISGMASSDYSTDGALGTSCVGLNPFVTPGLMRALASSTDISTSVAGNIIASSEDSNAVSPNNRYFIDDATNAANYYSYNGALSTGSNSIQATGGISDICATAFSFAPFTAVAVNSNFLIFL